MKTNDIAQLLRELRLKNNYTQEYLGHRLGKNQAYYSRLEAGNREITIKEAEILAKEYNLSIKKFFEAFDYEDKETLDKTTPFSDYLAKCFKEEYFKLLKAYIKLCEDNGIEPDLG